MQIRLNSTQNYGAQAGVKIVVYSPAGHGKTSLCATCPAPVILSAESGLLALAHHNLPYAEIRTIADLHDAYTWARSSNEARQFQTICLDSVSEVAEVVLAASLKQNKDGRKAYGEMIEEMTTTIKKFRDLPRYHVYMSAKAERIKDEASGVLIWGPMMPGNKLGQAMPYFPDELFYLGIEGTGPNSYRYLRTQPDFMFAAKDRSGVLNAIEEPHLGKIIDKITRASGGSA